MRIALRHLTNGKSGFTNNYNTASVSPKAGRLLILTVAKHLVESDGPGAPLDSISGLGITWELINTRQNNHDGKQRISMWKGRANGNVGQININPIFTARSIFWSVDEFRPVIKSLAKAVPQSTTQDYGTPDPMNITLNFSPFQSSKNGVFCAFISPDMPTLPSGFTSIVADTQDLGPDNNFRVMYKDSPQTSVNTTSTGSGAEVASGIGCEIRYAQYGGQGLVGLL